MIVQAKFKGRPSLGYVPGQIYILRVKNRLSMSIVRMDGTGYCPYQSLSAFLRNWDNIIHVEQNLKN